MRSQSELAKQYSVSREIAGRYERGDAVPSIDIAKRMADAFEVSLDYLVGAAEKQINKEMLHRVEDLNKMDRAGEHTSIISALWYGELCLTALFKLLPDKPGRKKDDLHLSGRVYY